MQSAAPSAMQTASPETATALIRELGRQEYESCFAAMRAFTDARSADTRDEIWLLEHPPVFTFGLGADRNHLLQARSDIPVIQTDRGGEITYHGPGQAVVYLLLDLRRHKPRGKLFARELVQNIEQAVINVLAKYNLRGERKLGAPGIYLADGPAQGAKIAALGLKVRANGCTYHGLALNVAMDLQAFSCINPCGYAGLQTVDMRSLGVEADPARVQQELAQELIALLY